MTESPKILSSVACNLDANILRAVLPLLAEERVQAIEWSFDALFNVKNIPSWFDELIQTYANAGRLVGHGVFFSLFSGRWRVEQQDWLNHLRQLSQSLQFDHITEHFGFMTGANFHEGAPLGLPFTETTLAIGQDRLKRMQDACACPVGLENLAFAYSLEEVKRHGEFLQQLLQPINGFIILDLHNLYCQLHNFQLTYEEVIGLYPLEMVREIHISGGSWADSEVEPSRSIRRDTHDDGVPNEVFELLQKTIPQCPNLKYVVMEQLGTGLALPMQQAQFQADFIKMDSIIRTFDESHPNPINDFLPKSPLQIGKPVESEALHLQQRQLATILENADSQKEAQAQLLNSSLAQTPWQVESWDKSMLETAVKIAQKWK